MEEASYAKATTVKGKGVKQISLKQYPWKEEEDNLIMRYYKNPDPEEKLKLPWGEIAQQLNDKYYNSNKIRSGHSCRERFINHLDPQLTKQK